MHCTIKQNTQISDYVDLVTNIAGSIYTPSNMTSTSFTFLVTYADSKAVAPLEDGAQNLYTVTVTPGRAVSLDPGVFASITGLFIVPGSVELSADKIVGIGTIPR